MAERSARGRLPGGANILGEYVGSSLTLSLGFFFATGSRYDPPGKEGTAHLVEHLLFKGTRHHSASSLARLVDRVGGDLNAWTDREEIAFTCTVPADAWQTAVDALCELCLFPTFPPDEFEREKEVIRNEILASLEDPEELSFDCFLQATAGEWGRPVAGTEDSLASIELSDAKAWWGRFGGVERMTVCFSGGVEPSVVQAALAARVPSSLVESPNLLPPRFFPVTKRWAVKADFQMVQVISGFTLPEPRDARDAAVWQIFSMLWGETMSSRLFQAIRERRGLCYSVTSQLFDADETWSLQVFVSCARENAQSVIDALNGEIARLASDPPTPEEWDDARRALKGGGIVAAERSENRMGRLWRTFESFGTVQELEEAMAILDQPVTAAEAEAVLGTLAQTPSLLVWGRLPRRLRLDPPK